MKEAFPSPPVGLLVSDAVADAHAAFFEALGKEAGIALRCYRPDAALQARQHIVAAFYSRDLYEGSSVRKPGVRSNAFFQIVDALENLRWLHVCSAGLDLPQYAFTLARGVRVTSSSGVTAEPIAQSVIAAMLAQSRGFDHWLAAQARHEWSPLTGSRCPRPVDCLRVLVLGAGPIGRAIGRLAQSVGMKATVVRRQARPTAEFQATVTFAQLDEALPQCDWLVLALPLTDETRQLMSARRLALLPVHARVVNVARGDLLDEEALIQALAAGQLAGAYLDTFMDEPLPATSPLWEMPSVWISPHNSAASLGHEARVVACFTAHLKAWLRQPDWAQGLTKESL